MLRQSLATLAVDTPGRGFVEITARVRDWVAGSGIADGLLTLFLRHTSASLLVTENAAPAVRRDLERFFARLVLDGDRLFEHDDEGPDDMPAHLRAALTQTHLAVPVQGGHLLLGTWQGIFLWEHRHAAHRRELVLHLCGEAADDDPH